MRDIGKYRGVRKDNGEWVYGDVIHFPATTAIGHPDKDGVCWEEYDVIPETVGQFTGKKDIDGVEIWEGDKVEYYIRKTRYVGQIAWGSIGFWLIGEIDKLNWVEHWKIKVIGNIHEDAPCQP